MSERIMIQISSGQGPEACELGVAKLYDTLCHEFAGTQLIDRSPGRRQGGYKSICFYGSDELLSLEGSVQWVCSSPFRPKHRRKNWFMDVSVCADADSLSFDKSKIRYEAFRSPGKGGQHVNKTESGVRAVYEPTGDSAVSTDERSQLQNKKTAAERLRRIIAAKNQSSAEVAKTQNWLENYKIVRGNPVQVYEGMDFILRNGSKL